MKYEFGALAKDQQQYSPAEIHVLEWSSIMLDSLKKAVNYYHKNNSQQPNGFAQKIDYAGPDRLTYRKKTPLQNVYCAIDLDNSDYHPENLASYDYNRSLPLKYIEQKVLCEAQMIVSDMSDNYDMISYEFFRNKSYDSGLYGAALIIRREFEKRIYLGKDKNLPKNDDGFMELNMQPKFVEVAPSRLLGQMDAQKLSEYLPELND